MRGEGTDQDKDRTGGPDPGRPRRNLRRRAEKSLEKRGSVESRALSPAEEQRMIHELQVHQIELEMQNEELEGARRNAEEAQEKYRELYDFAPVGYLTLGSGGRILELNLTGSLLLGKPRAHIVDRRFQSFLTRESIPVFNAFSTKVLETVDRQTCEIGIPSNGDEVRFFRIEGIASPGRYGAAQIQAALIDITESKRAEKELQTTLQRFYTVLSGAHSAILLATEDGRVEFVNQALCDLYGFDESPTDLAGLTSPQIIDKVRNGYEHPDEAVAHIRDILRRGEPVHGEEVVIRGRTVLRDFIPLQVGGKSYGRLWHHTDITRRKHAEEALRESESVLRSFFDAPGDMRGIVEVVSDHDVRHLADNAVMAGFLGFTPEEMRNRLGSELGEPDENLSRWIGFYDESRRTGKPVHFEYTDRRNGNEVFLSATVNYLGRNPAGEPRYAYVVQDITDRRQAEEALRRKQTEIQALFDNSPAGLVLFDAAPPYKVLVHNRYYQELFAEPFRSRGMVGLSVYDYAPAVEAEGVVAVFDEVVRTKQTKSFLDFPYRSNPPKETWYNWHMAPIILDGKVVALVSMSLDVTDRHLAEKALKESETRYRTVADNTYDWEFWLDPAGKFLYCSPSCEVVTGHTAAEFFADPGLRWSLIHPDDRAGFEEHQREVHEKREGGRGEWRYLRPDGTRCWVEHVCQPVYGEKGEFLGIRGSNRDITDRKEAEDALREAHDYLDHILQGISDAFYSLDREWRFRYVNQHAAGMTGRPPEDLLGRTIWEVFPMIIGTPLEAAYRKVMGEGVPIRLENQSSVVKDHWFEVDIHPIRDGITIFGREITERKRAEERIAHLASFPELNPNPVLELDSSGEIIYTNPAAGRALRNIGLGNNPALLVPERFQSLLPILLEGDVEEEVKVGGRVFLETIALNPSTRTVKIYARDITDRNQAEEALRRTSEYLENLINHANAPIIVWDPQFRITRFNHAFEHLTGRTAEEVMGKDLKILFPAGGVRSSMEHIRKVMAGERWEAVEIPILHKDGEIRTVLWNSATIYEADGKTVSSAIAQGQDITERKQAELALRETSQYLENLINHANAPIIVWDPEFRITRFNQAFERLTGRSAEEMIGTNLENLFPPETVTGSMDLIRKAMGGERWEAVEIPVLRKDGETRTVLWNSATLYEADGKTVSSAIAQGQDITDRKRMVEEIAQKAGELAEANAVLSAEIFQRKQAEEEVRKTLSILHAALESTADAMLVIDKSGRITSHNQNFTTMWHIPESVLHTLDTRITTERLAAQAEDPDGFVARLEEISKHPSMESYDTLELLDGRIIERYSKPQRIGNTIVGRVFSFRDVTERKRAEIRLIQSLEEKEVLLREIHHRVKNNLQLTTSLLDMTRMRTTDQDTGSILTDVMMKIQTMAQIHTRLYESKRFDRINMDRQIRDQVQALTNIYGSGDREIRTEIDSPELYLPLDQAIPCALALNEILSNAYKHAFKGRRSGTVKFRASEVDNSIRFTISDNGVGLPGEFDLNRTNTLGLKLVRTLVEQQLRGTLGMKRRKRGTEVIVEIPVKEEEHVKDTRG